jgi:Sigma-54 interaction domain
MAATVAFADLGNLAGAGFPTVSEVEDQQLYLEPEISSEHRFEDIVGKSAALRKVLEQVAIVAPTDAPVLLHGETGTGRELVARAIHNLSSRRDRPYVRMNCAAIPSGCWKVNCSANGFSFTESVAMACDWRVASGSAINRTLITEGTDKCCVVPNSSRCYCY